MQEKAVTVPRPFLVMVAQIVKEYLNCHIFREQTLTYSQIARELQRDNSTNLSNAIVVDCMNFFRGIHYL